MALRAIAIITLNLELANKPRETVQELEEQILLEITKQA